MVNAFEPLPLTPPQATPGLTDVMNDPTARAMLLQLGLGMMTPPSPGQGAFSQMAQAIGGVGEQQDRVAKQDLAESALDIKSEAQQSKNEYYGGRLANSRRRTDIAAERAAQPRNPVGRPSMKDILARRRAREAQDGGEQPGDNTPDNAPEDVQYQNEQLVKARQAIAQGADRAAVIRRLQQFGIKPVGI